MQRERGTKGKVGEGGWMERLRAHSTVALSAHNKEDGHGKRSRLLYIPAGLDRKRRVRKTGQNRHTVLAGFGKASVIQELE